MADYLTEKAEAEMKAKAIERAGRYQAQAVEIRHAAMTLEENATGQAWGGFTKRAVEALVAEAEAAEANREAAWAEVANLTAIAEAPRTRFYRAWAALKKDFDLTASLNEAKDGTKKSRVEVAEENGTPRVWTYGSRMRGLWDGNDFAKDGWTTVYGEDGERTCARQGVYLYHGPTLEFAREVAHHFRSFGLGVEWDEERGTADAIFVTSEESLKVRAQYREARRQERLAWEREAAEDAALVSAS